MKKINDGLSAQQRYYRKNRDKVHIRANNSDKRHRTRIKRMYGVSQSQYDEMMEVQNAKCAICNTDFSEFRYRPSIDHDHTTGKVRALLCNPCNIKVGYVETEGPWREAVLAYLASHKKEG